MAELDLGLEIQKSNVGIRINILEIPCVPFFRKNRKIWLFRPKFAKKKFWGRNFKNLSLDSESAPPRYQVCQFSAKTDNFEFFGLNLGKFPNYVQYFGSNYVDGVGESWLEADVNWMEVDGAGWRLKLAEWRWMDLGGEGWR